MKRLNCRVLIMEPCVQVEYLIQARDNLWAKGREWERWMNSGENLKIEFAGLGNQKISQMQKYRFNRHSCHSISDEAVGISESTFSE